MVGRLPTKAQMEAIQKHPIIIASLAALAGLGISLLGFRYLESPFWLLFWFALIAILTGFGFTAAPVFKEKSPLLTKPRRVRDGPLLMMDLPGGKFLMGSPDSDDMARDNEKPQHEVTVPGFRIATTPVTAGLYHDVMKKDDLPEDKALLPIVNVSWYDAVEFCNALSKREGHRRCYWKLFGRWWCDWRADGYRLPTEAEWEYACRAGTKTRYSFGNDPARLGAYAWFSKNSRGPQPVSTKPPNHWGLYDMHGNVWEWCWNYYESYTSQSLQNPHGPKKSEDGRRVLRGGSFVNSPVVLRSALRVDFRPVLRFDLDGFRCVRVPPQH